MSSYTISFIGSGNLAWHLAPALDNVGYVVREVYSRNPKSAKELTQRLYQAEIKTTLDFSTSESQIFIIAVSDDAIKSIVQDIVLPDGAILLHTSGSQPLSVLAYAATEHIGVFYPLQTFSKSKKVEFKSIPIFIESETPVVEKICMQMGKKLSADVRTIGSRERKALHVAAVFASNFANHMLTISKDLLNESKLDFELLKPLISETINKGLAIGPDQAQTGPAIRGDYEILDHHLEFLKNDESLASIYKLISQHILDRYETE
ncbi:MAG TPA: Rossmann-like and DUF2520 domain-containing protein [Cyclobacteriaceae bacterium]